MAFKKGNKYGKGRPKGSKNKTSAEIRNFFTQFVGEHTSELKKAFEELDARDKFKYLLEMSKFVVPTLRSVRNTIDELSDEQFDNLINELKNRN